MTNLQIALVLLVVLCLWRPFVYLKSRYWINHNLPSPPGYSFTKTGSIPSDHRAELFHQYGKTLFIHAEPDSRPVVVTCDPSFVDTMIRHSEDFEISSRLGSTFSKIGMTKCVASVLGETHQRIRRVFQQAFSYSAARDFYPRMLEVTDEWRDKVLEDEVKEIALHDTLSRIMSDIFSTCGLGRRGTAVQTGKKSEMGKIVGEYYQKRDKVRGADRIGAGIFKTKRFLEMQEALRNIPKYAFNVIKDVKGDLAVDSEKARSFIGDMCRTDRLSDEELAHNVPAAMIGSTDATVSSIAVVLLHIAADPGVQARLRKELEASPTDLEQLNHIQYLDHAIEEALRLHNPYVFIERKVTGHPNVPLMYPVKGRDGRMVENLRLEPGTEVWVDTRNFNADEKLYGPDSDKYRPERFEDGTVSSEMRWTWGNTSMFWGGGRGCPVWNYPLAACKAIVTTMVQSFELSLVEGDTASGYYNARQIPDVKPMIKYHLKLKPIDA